MTGLSLQALVGERRTPPANSVVELIHRVCRSEPGRPALAFHDRRISFGELWARASDIAVALADTGVEAGDRVLLWADRSARPVPQLAGTALRSRQSSSRCMARSARVMSPSWTAHRFATRG